MKRKLVEILLLYDSRASKELKKDSRVLDVAFAEEIFFKEKQFITIHHIQKMHL